MMKHPTPHRPAWAAIAAVLALSSTPLLAQTVAAPPAPAAPPTVVATQPVVSAPAPVIIAPAPATPAPAPMIQATPAPVVQAPVVDPAPVAQAAPARVVPQRIVREAPAPVETRTSAAAPRPAEVATPVAAPVAPEAQAPVAPAPIVASETPAPSAPLADSNSLLLTAIAALAALFALGGIVALTRRRKRVEEDVFAPDYAVPVIESPGIAAPAQRAPTPVLQTQARPESLEAMIEQGPTAENPFLTRKNRLRRAAFLMRQNDSSSVVAAPAPAPSYQPAYQPVAHADRAAPVYDFGGRGKRGPSFKPVTT